ncbi:MAG TPA: hypothetical protein VF789_12575 [Thermoanaerobaculia bacterium]
MQKHRTPLSEEYELRRKRRRKIAFFVATLLSIPLLLLGLSKAWDLLRRPPSKLLVHPTTSSGGGPQEDPATSSESPENVDLTTDIATYWPPSTPIPSEGETEADRPAESAPDYLPASRSLQQNPPEVKRRDEIHPDHSLNQKQDRNPDLEAPRPRPDDTSFDHDSSRYNDRSPSNYLPPTDPRLNEGILVTADPSPTPEALKARPQRPLRLPRVPSDTQRSLLSGKKVDVTAYISTSGRATILTIEFYSDISPRLKKMIELQVEQTVERVEWVPARDSLGRVIPSNVKFPISWP